MCTYISIYIYVHTNWNMHHYCKGPIFLVFFFFKKTINHRTLSFCGFGLCYLQQIILQTFSPPSSSLNGLVSFQPGIFATVSASKCVLNYLFIHDCKWDSGREKGKWEVKAKIKNWDQQKSWLLLAAWKHFCWMQLFY